MGPLTPNGANKTGQNASTCTYQTYSSHINQRQKEKDDFSELLLEQYKGQYF